MPRPRVYVLPAGKLQEQLFPTQVRDALAEFADPVYREGEGEITSEELAALLPGFDALITGWGAPKLTAEVLDAAKDLKIVAHAAGSVKFMLPEPPSEFFRRGLRMTCATSTMEPDTLIEKRVGIVGLGKISWQFIRLLKPLGCEVWAYSKHADRKRVEAEGVKLVELDELLRNCRIVVLLAAVRPDTIGMISRERLKLMADGSVLVNPARGALVDEQALIEEVQAGRLWAGLDVTYPEPPAADNPLRDCPHVLLTPHVGGPVPSRYWDMAAHVVEELRRFFSGEPLLEEVTEQRLEGMA